MKIYKLSEPLPKLKERYLTKYNKDQITFAEHPEELLKHNAILTILNQECDSVERDIFIMYCDMGSYLGVAKVLTDVNYQVIKRYVDKVKEIIKTKINN